MGFLKFMIKVLIILAMVLLMAAPFFLEFFTYRRDKEKKICYKRFRIVVYTGVYIILITLILYLLKEVMLWVQNLAFIQWIANKISVDGRVGYCVKVLAAILVNFAIGVLYRFFGKFVRIGLKKKNLTDPKKDGEFSWRQKLERKIIKFFHTETWFFVAKILKYLSIILSSVYALIFVLYQIPAFFAAWWIPYDFISMLFGAGYIYPTISLLGLWEMYFFLEGLKMLESECPELLRKEEETKKKIEDAIADIDAAVKEKFKDYYACDVELERDDEKELKSEHHLLTKFIGSAVENDERITASCKERYLSCIDKLVIDEKSVIINGGFFSEFSLYFLRYLSVVAARGDNIIFICNNDSQIDAVYDYIIEGLSKQHSLYCKNFQSEEDKVNLDDPIWRVIKVSGDRSVVEDAAVDENNILITSLGFLCSPRFESEHSKFIAFTDTVVFVDTLNTVNKFNRQMALLNTRLKHMTRRHSLEAKNGKAEDLFKVRYMSRQVRYICFDDTRIPGLDKVLKNFLSVDFVSADSMVYSKNAVIRCYNYEGKPDENGNINCPQFFQTDEKIGAVINMAVLCLEKGASSVTVFADDIIPYANFAETIAANSGHITVSVNAENITINKRFYNPDDYSVIFAVESRNNLPQTVRRYAAMAPDKPTLIVIFSRPYMMRDYYIGNIEKIWASNQIERIPVEEGTHKDFAQKVLVKANSGGISKTQILNYAMGISQFAEFVKNKDISSILRAILAIYGISASDRIDLFKVFEYEVSHDFDENGKYKPEEMIHLIRNGKVFDMINGRDMVVMYVGDREYILPMPKSRLTQNYIAGQNLLYDGNIYHIQQIDTSSGSLYAKLAVSGINNEAYQYLQDREYRITFNPESATEHVFPTKHVVLTKEQDGISISDVFVSVFKAPMEVVTRGYYIVKSHILSAGYGLNEYYSISDAGNDLLAKQTYRRYGKIEEPFYSPDSVMKETEITAYENEALMMSVKICGEFGSDVNKIMALSSAMLNELIREMFPSVADSVAVCPVIREEFTDDEAKEVFKRQPKIVISGENDVLSGDGFELVIIEDCESDLGVVSVLMSAGDDILKTLFTPVFNYLTWYFESEQKSDYLYFGLDHEPSCFDFKGLHSLSKIVGDDKQKFSFIEAEDLIKYDNCDFCGKRCEQNNNSIIELEDGRKMCKECAENLVGNNKKILKAHLESAKMFLESTYGITLDDDYEFCFESTVKIINTLKQNREFMQRGLDVPLKGYVDDKKKVHVEYSIPSASLSELLVRELTYVWQLKNLPEIAEDLAEGHIALVAIQYLKFLGQNSLVTVRSTYYESTDNISGVGYRKLVGELLVNPQFNNNPFKYLASVSEGDTGYNTIPFTPPVKIGKGDYGLPYTPEKPDRALDGNIEYFYYSRLTPTKQEVYTQMLEAVKNHEQKIIVSGCEFKDVEQVWHAILYDHPELFWFRSFSMLDNEVTLIYGASAEEVATLQKRIDEEAAKYLADIDDTMSAYDVAVRLHIKIINSVDYDTIALNKEKQEGGPETEKIDYIRSICGVFIDKKAVCAGYASALQYLLQKCGIEAAYAAGIVKKSGGGHAWVVTKIDGDYYYIDSTWDDSSDTVQTVKDTNIAFSFFCITTEEILRTRNFERCPIAMPEFTATKANYYVHNGFLIDSYDLAKIKEIAKVSAESKRSHFTVKCTSRALYNQTKQKLIHERDDRDEALRVAAKADKTIDLSCLYSYHDEMWTVTVYFKYKK